jgi:hypothetical protein
MDLTENRRKTNGRKTRVQRNSTVQTQSVFDHLHTHSYEGRLIRNIP